MKMMIQKATKWQVCAICDTKIYNLFTSCKLKWLQVTVPQQWCSYKLDWCLERKQIHASLHLCSNAAIL